MKRKLISILNIIILIIIVAILIFFYAPEISENDEDKIKVIATIFPNYDLVKQIGGDKVDVKLLLNSGVESHTYEPTPRDMIAIENSDIFIYTGNEFEPWAENLIDGKVNDYLVMDISKNIDLIDKEEFEKMHYNESIDISFSENMVDNFEEYTHTEYSKFKHTESSHDSHIWLNPQNFLIMVDSVVDVLCNIDSKNSDYYIENANQYKSQIQQLDIEFENLIKNSKRKEIVFAGEFSYSYFIERYGLNFVSVYNNCGEGEDPSISKVKSIIDYINNNKLPVVFYEELSEGTIAKMIEEETEAKSMIFYTIHNANTEEDSYLTLMKKNYENLSEALN